MTITKVNAFIDNYIWIIIEDNKKYCHCIDPGQAAPVIDFLKSQELELKTILLTHHHFDHQAGVKELIQSNPNITIYGPDDDRMYSSTHAVNDLDTLCMGGMSFQVLAIPGHTSSHIAYYEATLGLLFCGDTLFSAGCGRVFDGTIEQLYNSLLRLSNLPDATAVYCAHEYTLNNLRFALSVEPNNTVASELAERLSIKKACSLPSTIALEKKINPFLRLQEKQVRQYARLLGENDEPLSIFSCLRAQKDIF